MVSPRSVHHAHTHSVGQALLHEQSPLTWHPSRSDLPPAPTNIPTPSWDGAHTSLPRGIWVLEVTYRSYTGFLPGSPSPGSLPTDAKQCRTPPRPAANAASCWGHGRLGPSWRIPETSGRERAERSQEGAVRLGTSLLPSLGSPPRLKISNSKVTKAVLCPAAPQHYTSVLLQGPLLAQVEMSHPFPRHPAPRTRSQL